MAVRPLLRFPTPASVAPPSVPGGGSKPKVPSHDRQQQRLGPIYKRLRTALDAPDGGLTLRADPTSIAADRAIVLEIAGSLANFYKAANQVPGLEFLIDEAFDFAADTDFSETKKGEPRLDRPVSGRRYIAMPSQAALEQLLGLYERWDRGEITRGWTPWRNLFDQLKTLRPWGPEDRIADDAVALWEDDIRSTNATTVIIEAEFWFHDDPLAQDAAFEALTADIAALAGEVITACVIEPIRYHAALLRVPIDGMRRIMRREQVAIVLADQIMAIRPQATLRGVEAPELAPAGRAIPPLASASSAPAIAALLDGFPVQRHELLLNRLTIDDPDGLEAKATLDRRCHGTAMASLILHGDLNGSGESLGRPLHVSPIMYAATGAPQEHAEPQRILINTVYQAVKRMKDTQTPGGPTAPEVFLINLSMGDARRPFTGPISPWARLLDFLSAKYDVLFLVSAGNIDDEFALAGFNSIDQAERASAQVLSTAVLSSLRERQSSRTLLSPAEALNPLTIGALHSDEVSSRRLPLMALDPHREAVLPMVGSALGLGHRRVVKPDLLFPGGRQPLRYKSGPPLVVRPATSAQNFGLRAASPDTARRGSLSDRTLTCGTSAATALATRAAHQVFDALTDAEGGSQHADIDPEFRAVVVKALLVHASKWPSSAQMIAEIFGPFGNGTHATRFDNVSRLLGYGVPETARVLSCTSSQATLAGWGELTGEECHAYRVPLPSCLESVTEPRRLVVTVAWMSPITLTQSDYRRAQLYLDQGGELGVSRLTEGQPTDHASKRGTVIHEIYEGAAAVPFVDDGWLNLQLWCKARPKTIPLVSPVRYGLAVTIEAGTALPIYDQVEQRIRPLVRA